MKGVVFTEFLEMVESLFGLDTTDTLLDLPGLESGGAYTAVGTYDASELVAMVLELSRLEQTPVPELLHAYGKHLFGRFVQLFPQMFEGVSGADDFLGQVDGHIHVEVRKLYPGAICVFPGSQEKTLRQFFLTASSLLFILSLNSPNRSSTASATLRSNSSLLAPLNSVCSAAASAVRRKSLGKA